MPVGRLNSPSPLPEVPNCIRKRPSAVNFWTRSLRQSVTYTLPSASMSIPQGTVRTDAAAKFSDIFLVYGADGNALAIWSPLIGAVEHIEPVAGVTGYAHRGTEPRSGELGTADGMAVLQLYRVDLRNHVHLTEYGLC